MLWNKGLTTIQITRCFKENTLKLCNGVNRRLSTCFDNNKALLNYMINSAVGLDFETNFRKWSSALKQC